MTKKATLLWLDLEMTGLDSRGDLILEVAAIASDWEFQELASLEAIIQHDEALIRDKFALNTAFWEQNARARDGLLEQNSRGESLLTTEHTLMNFVDEHFKKDTPVLLAGNSIHVDRQFIITAWPRFNARLHYRMLDVSAWKVVFEGKYKKKFVKPEEHRAVGDIRGSIEELKYYLSNIKA